MNDSGEFIKTLIERRCKKLTPEEIEREIELSLVERFAFIIPTGMIMLMVWMEFCHSTGYSGTLGDSD